MVISGMRYLDRWEKPPKVAPPQTDALKTAFRMRTTSGSSHLVQLYVWHHGDSAWVAPALGDYVEARGHVARPRNRGNPDEFDYAGWLWCQGVSGTGSVAPRGIVRRPPTTDEWHALPWTERWRVEALKVRQRLLVRLAHTGLEGQTLAVVSALTLADRSRLEAATRDMYADAGASHLLALSGMHLGIVIGVLLALLHSRLAYTWLRIPLCVLSLVFTWSYAVVAGLPTSLLRASLMASVAMLAVAADRHGTPLHHLVLTVLVMLAADPTCVFDVGAQLSVAAVAGIILFYVPVQRWAVHRWRFAIMRLRRYGVYWPVELLHMSLAAQVLTLPLVAWRFGRIALYGPLTSVVLVPLTTCIIYASMALMAVGGGASWLTSALTWSVRHLVVAQAAVVQTAAGLPGAVVPDFWSERAHPQVVVYNNRRCPALHFIAAPDSSWLLTPRPDSVATGMADIAASFWNRRLTRPPVTMRGAEFMRVRNTRAIMFCQPVRRKRADDCRRGVALTDAAPTPGAEPVDLVWLCGAYRGRLADALTWVRPRMVVIDASLPRHLRRELGREAAALGLAAHDVAVRGALRVRLE